MEIRRHTPTKNSLEYSTGLFLHKNLVCMTYGDYTISVQYVGVEAKDREAPNVRKLTLRLSEGVQELCVAPANF